MIRCDTYIRTCIDELEAKILDLKRVAKPFRKSMASSMIRFPDRSERDTTMETLADIEQELCNCRQSISMYESFLEAEENS